MGLMASDIFLFFFHQTFSKDSLQEAVFFFTLRFVSFDAFMRKRTHSLAYSDAIDYFPHVLFSTQWPFR